VWWTCVRSWARRNFYYLATEVLGYRDLNKELHGDLCRFMSSTAKKKMIIIPRGHFKTTLCTISNAVRHILLNDSVRILIASCTLKNAMDFLQLVKSHFVQNEYFRFLFPEFCPLDAQKEFGTREHFTVLNRKNFRLVEHTVECIGSDGKVTGRHYDVIIKDDLVTRETVTTSDQIEKSKDWNKYSQSLFNVPEEDVEYVIGTRYHFNDLYGEILDDEETDYKVYLRRAIEDDKPIFKGRFTIEGLNSIRKNQGSYIFSCNPGWTPIWMPDGRFKNLEDIKVGDNVVGFILPKGKRRRMIPSKVLAVGSRIAQTVKVTMESGREVICTPDHKWFTGRQDDTHRLYAPAHVGGRLMHVIDPPKEISPEMQRDYDWLAGMIDGEGACKHGSISISQSVTHNPRVCKRIEEVIARLKLPLYLFEDKREGVKKKSRAYILNGGRQTKIDIINHGNPVKSDQIMSTVLKYSSRMVDLKDKVVKIEPHKRERVYSMQTETGNYIAHGYASSNCQYMNDPVSDDTAIFRHDQYQEIEPAQILTPHRIFITTDIAASEKKTADHSVIMVSAYDYLANIYILEIFMERVHPTKFINKLFELHEKWSPVRRISFETSTYQMTLLHHIKKEEARRGIILPKKELPRDTRESKFSRILHLQPRFENGTIFVAKGIKNSKELLNQMVRYPKTTHDDLLDTISDIDLIATKPTKKDKTADPSGTILELVKNVQEAERMSGIPGNEQFGFMEFYRSACGYID
jgi:predicted phage terminase large subunit-like protein